MKKYKLFLTCSIIYSLVTFILTIALMCYHGDFGKVEDFQQILYFQYNGNNNSNDRYNGNIDISQDNIDLYQECSYLAESKSKLISKISYDFNSKIDTY
jgi:hypothetical protein